jgi:DNA invertase Pin-like site-specific DNA recombinase
MRAPAPRILRCAIYTRVSTDAGLEQEFNSLDNQREAAEAYIRSQSHEGWRLHPARYDDGGYSGGSTERPALQALLSDIRANLIDIVVVYKVDRLTRSLADFAKLVELFDQHRVSFVSVTQAFNTTNSMGRLTLNVLLSFAQFEREVTGERIRDKIAASKKKGIWMGGHVPLGYRVENRKLAVDEAEAAHVRLIFERYLALGSLTPLLQELRERGITSKQRMLATGKIRGGIPFTRGPVAYLLKNRTYLGEILHRGQRYEGEHEAIISRELFDAVKEQLAQQWRGRSQTTAATSSLLTGRIFDDRGHRMSPAHTQKGGARYRYYVSCALAQGRKGEAGSVSRVPAPEIETVILKALRDCTRSSEEPCQAQGCSEQEWVAALVDRVVVQKQGLTLTLRAPSGSEGFHTVTLPWSPLPHYRRRQVIAPSPADGSQSRHKPIRAEARTRLIEAIAKARLWLEEMTSHEEVTTRLIAQREGCSERYVRLTLSLAFLAPGIVQAAIHGTLPHGAGLSALAELPPSWQDQYDHVRSG